MREFLWISGTRTWVGIYRDSHWSGDNKCFYPRERNLNSLLISRLSPPHQTGLSCLLSKLVGGVWEEQTSIATLLVRNTTSWLNGAVKRINTDEYCLRLVYLITTTTTRKIFTTETLWQSIQCCWKFNSVHWVWCFERLKQKEFCGPKVKHFVGERLEKLLV